MEEQRLSSEIIDTLPQSIIENILTLMPIRDALRTSILSRKWRYCWTRMPKLLFDDEMLNVSSSSISTQLKKYVFVNAVFHVLLLHKGPILKFILHIHQLEMVSEIDQIILHLSRNNSTKEFTLEILTKRYKLPRSFFSLQGLELLIISKCDFEPPLTFNGFSKLHTLWFDNIGITSKTLQCLLTNSPLLEDFVLSGCPEYFAGGNKFTFVELFDCLPSIVTLEISKYYMKSFAASGMPHKLQTSLVYLENLYLDVCFMEQDVLSCTLCLIMNSPNLYEIYLTIYEKDKPNVQQDSMNLFDLKDYSGFNLDHLNKLKITGFCNLPLEMAFVKLVMAKSPVLKKVQIVLSAKVSVDDELNMLKDLLRLPLERASPQAKFTIQRP